MKLYAIRSKKNGHFLNRAFPLKPHLLDKVPTPYNSICETEAIYQRLPARIRGLVEIVSFEATEQFTVIDDINAEMGNEIHEAIKGIM